VSNANLKISPSVLSADFTRLAAEIASLNDAGCSLLHLDVMDGQYVPNITFGPMIVEAIRRLTDMELEAHLMIADPDKYIADFINAGADLVLIHPSTVESAVETLANIRKLGARAGVVINPNESLDLATPLLKHIDQLLIMSVYPGFGGQKFIPEVLDSLPAHLPAVMEAAVTIEIDGGVNISTLPNLQGRGISRFVAGSAVFNKKATPAENYRQLVKLLG
jgi:ribulose-phosphate 3-epimerase